MSNMSNKVINPLTWSRSVVALLSNEKEDMNHKSFCSWQRGEFKRRVVPGKWEGETNPKEKYFKDFNLYRDR